MSTPMAAIDWSWVRLQDAVDPMPFDAGPEGFVALVDHGEADQTVLMVIELSGGKRTVLERGSLDLAIDVDSWSHGKEVGEVLLRHAIAINQELSR